MDKNNKKIDLKKEKTRHIVGRISPNLLFYSIAVIFISLIICAYFFIFMPYYKVLEGFMTVISVENTNKGMQIECEMGDQEYIDPVSISNKQIEITIISETIYGLVEVDCVEHKKNTRIKILIIAHKKNDCILPNSNVEYKIILYKTNILNKIINSSKAQ